MSEPSLLPFLNELKLTHDHKNKQDAEATKALLDFYQQHDGWHCPRCDLITTNPDDFAEHIIHELKKAIADMSTYMKPPNHTSPNPIPNQHVLKYPRQQTPEDSTEQWPG
jgi:hypothetical protein